MLVRIVLWLLRRKSLSSAERTLLINQILSATRVFPTHAIITKDGGKIFIRGVPLDVEKAMVLRESALVALSNPALKMVHEQALYDAISLSLHESQNFEQVSFGKAAVWYGQREIELLKTFAGNTSELLTDGD